METFKLCVLEVFKSKGEGEGSDRMDKKMGKWQGENRLLTESMKRIVKRSKSLRD
jgi:hypothetical protein